MNITHTMHAGDSGNNNLLPLPEFASSLGENDHIKLNDNGWLCGFRVDNVDGPQVTANQVAVYADGVTPSIREVNMVITETITTHNQREANYVHGGWSVGAVATASPWTLSRIAMTNRHNEEGVWITRVTLVPRLKVQVLLEDLVPAPEFKMAIEEALGRPTKFEKFQAVYRTLERWGDVVPLTIEMGTSLAMTDSEKNFNHLPTTDAYNSLTHLSTIKTASIAKTGTGGDGWDDGSWIAKDVPAAEWQTIRIIAAAPTIRLLPSSLQAQLTELYVKRLTYVPPSTFDPIGWQRKINDDINNASRTISKVEIRGTDFIDGISVNYLDGFTSRSGGNGGNLHKFTLTKGEHIIEMMTCGDGGWLHGVQFVTDQGRCSPIYGKLEGIPTILRSNGGILAGLSTVTKKHPEWDYLVSGVTGIWRHDVIPRAPKENDVYSDYYGARTGSGKGFNDRVLIGNSSSICISGVEVRAGDDIDSIQFTYTDANNDQTPKFKTARHGGCGGRVYQFQLRQGEHIVSVSGKFNDRFLTQLCFGTNMGRTSEVYGRGNGRSFSTSAPSKESEKSWRLQYIIGKSNDSRLNGAMFVWTPNLPQS